ncbi:MAG: helix-turn-helix transcriptional regulator, partial [Deltaproteobacteria bacterium]|nr:helix-turn-helix transcriptional regulator [Deltaproteobacteria bacterium]
MAPREDGMETRRRLLEAACEVFAEKGYRAATIADICRRDFANALSLNLLIPTKVLQRIFCRITSTPSLKTSPRKAAGGILRASTLWRWP